MPGGGFTGNYYEIDDDEFVNRDTPPAGCLDDDPGDCVDSWQSCAVRCSDSTKTRARTFSATAADRDITRCS